MFQPRNYTKGDDNNPVLVGKEKELYESKNWPKSFSKQVDITKIKIDSFKPWITKRVSELMGIEDDIVVDYCMGQLKDLGESDAKRNSQLAGDGGSVFNEKPRLDPKRLQISLTGFMAKKASVFVRELWDLLLSAQESDHGIPQSFIQERKEQLNDQHFEDAKLEKRSPSGHSELEDVHKHKGRDHSDHHVSNHSKRERRERESVKERSRRHDRDERRRHRRHRGRSRSPRSVSPRKRQRSSSGESHSRRRRRRHSSRERHRTRRSHSRSPRKKSSSSSGDTRRRNERRRHRDHDYYPSSSSSIDPERVKELSKQLANRSESP